MDNKERTFNAFRICITDRKCENTDCPYEYECEKVNNGQIQIPKVLALDVMQLLKEQMPVKQYQDYNGHDVWRCGKCGATICNIYHSEADEDSKNYAKFCIHCGSAIEWEST